MKNKVNIGLIGLAGSGKDTVADMLKDIGYTKVSFATELKKMCLALGWDGEKDVKGRKLLQDVGMALRIYDDNTWVHKTHKSLESNYANVFSDVRFDNEAKYIKYKLQGIIVRIVRPSLEMTEAHTHVSEYGQKEIPVDYTIINDQDLTSLKIQILNIVSNYACHISKYNNY